MLTYTHYDRMIVGGAHAQQMQRWLCLAPKTLKATSISGAPRAGHPQRGWRRPGAAWAAKCTSWATRTACTWARAGARCSFLSADASQPAKFYLLSAPAHHAHPTRRLTQAEATPVEMGARETANERTIYKYIYNEGIQSCQLVMGLTRLKPGSVWNTMPSHVHDRRMEAYLYFDLAAGQRVLHLMGEPQETRPLWVSEGQAILSPPWSIHTGCGTGSYSFIWGMAGENREYTDMDAVALDALR
jgi:4-deoxy-L-threo-5-hexosulose-uronate ketol-isomerase